MRCEECGQKAEDDAQGWVAYYVDLPFGDSEPMVTVYCPICREREFGGKTIDRPIWQSRQRGGPPT
jgi:hypothetical protein